MRFRIKNNKALKALVFLEKNLRRLDMVFCHEAKKAADAAEKKANDARQKAEDAQALAQGLKDRADNDEFKGEKGTKWFIVQTAFADVPRDSDIGDIILNGGDEAVEIAGVEAIAGELRRITRLDPFETEYAGNIRSAAVSCGCEETDLKEIIIKIQSAEEWETQNPVLEAGKFGFDTTNDILKAGNGFNTWKGLPLLIEINKTPSLPAPVNLVARSGAKTLRWEAVPSASGYKVEITGQQIMLETTDETILSLAGLDAGVYLLKVKAEGDTDNWRDSEWSEVVVVEIFDVPVSLSFAEDDWDTIYGVAQAGKARDYYNVGDSKDIELTTGEVITVLILGFDHDELVAGGRAAMTIGMENLLTAYYSLNLTATNLGGWDASHMRNTTMHTLYNMLPDQLQFAIAPVNKFSMAGGKATSIVVSPGKLFLFSQKELSDSTGVGYSGEGEQYEYWRTIKNGAIESNLIKLLSNGAGEAGGWRLRTPVLSGETDFYYINFSGKLKPNAGNVEGAVCFGFCI
jgi:hypothetical protein